MGRRPVMLDVMFFLYDLHQTIRNLIQSAPRRKPGALTGMTSCVIRRVERESVNMYANLNPRTQFTGRGKRVLVVDADKNTRISLAACLQGGDFDVQYEASGTNALAQVGTGHNLHLIIMDIDQPDIDGLQLGETLSQKHDIPVIVVSNIVDIETIVRAIDKFADDYVRKPFDKPELLARVHRVLLRVGLPYEGTLASRQRVAGDLYIDFDAGYAYLNGERRALTPIEGQILRILHRNQGQIVPYETLISEIWHADNIGQLGTLWVHVRRLRTKIESNPRKPTHVLTVRGTGYRLTQ